MLHISLKRKLEGKILNNAKKKAKRSICPKKLGTCFQSALNQADVSLALARYVSQNKAKESKNIVLSPLSINVVVSLIAAGASGETLRELLSYLKSDSIDDVNRLSKELVSVVLADGFPRGGPKISVANSIWLQKGLSLKPSFKHVVERSYKADAFQVDFNKAVEVISQVNSWVEKRTNGLFKQAISPNTPVDSKTKLILANALYFKGEWDHKFDPSKTKKDDFHLLCGDSVKVPFMQSNQEQFISVFDRFKVLRLPYKQGRDKRRQFSMYIFLPDSTDGLPGLVDRVGSETGFLDRHLPREEVEVNKFRLPKFKFSYTFEASEAVKKLGAPLAFERGLTEMVDPSSSDDLIVSKIFHKAFIEVNEEGTEAAAVSVGLIGCRRFRPPGVDFVADHPFLFLIREDTIGAVLFFGQVLNPLQE